MDILLFLLIIFLFLYLSFERLYKPWNFIDGESYNIIGKNKYGETKKERSKRLKKEIQAYVNYLNKIKDK